MSVAPFATSTLRSRSGAAREAREISVAASAPNTIRPTRASGALLSIAWLTNSSARATVSASMLLETSRANITSVCCGDPRSRGPARAAISAAIASPRNPMPAKRRKRALSPRFPIAPHPSSGNSARSASHQGCANSGTGGRLRLHDGVHSKRRDGGGKSSPSGGREEKAPARALRAPTTRGRRYRSPRDPRLRWACMPCRARDPGRCLCMLRAGVRGARPHRRREARRPCPSVHYPLPSSGAGARRLAPGTS